MRRWPLALIDASLLTASLVFGLISFVKARRRPSHSFSSFATPKPADAVPAHFPPNPSAPPPRPFAPSAPPDAVYVAVLDLGNRPRAHHCLMKDQWIDPFLARPEVENVELYSQTAWAHPSCGLRSIGIAAPPSARPDPSPWLLLQSVALALNRSASPWLFVVSGAVHIRLPRFFDFVADRTRDAQPLNRTVLLGSCYEKRYLFQVFVPDSGVMVSRHLAETLVRDAAKWEIFMDAEIGYDDALAHLSGQPALSSRSGVVDEFLGRTWRNASDFDLLESKSFDGLKECAIPQQYLMRGPAELGLCSSRITPVNSLITWAVGDGMDPAEFLRKAPRFLEGNPDNLAYYWDLTKPTLCLIQQRNV
jgi:hypothetical protein